MALDIRQKNGIQLQKAVLYEILHRLKNPKTGMSTNILFEDFSVFALVT